MLTWQLVVMFLSLGIAVAAIVIAVMNRHSARDMIANELQLENRIVVLESELSAMMDGAFGVASHLQKVEGNLKDTVQRQEQLQQRDMGNLPYNDAVRLASKGASVDELVEHCSLSRSEAELVAMLHKKSSPVVSNEDDISHEQPVSRQAEPPTDEQLNATEQAIEKLMAEQFSQLQTDPLSGASDAEGEEYAEMQPSDAISDNADETLSFDDALARSKGFQKQPDSLNDPAAAEDSTDTPKAPHGSDERH